MSSALKRDVLWHSSRMIIVERVSKNHLGNEMSALRKEYAAWACPGKPGPCGAFRYQFQ
jgi:hypothetical protein